MSERTVPEVRFRGFSGEWENDLLGAITDVYDGTHQTPKYTESGIMFLSVENIKTLQSEKYISENDFINGFKVFPQKNDVLMTRIGDVGTANVVDNDTKKAYYVSLALLKYKKLNSYFLRESIHSQTVKREIWHRTLHIAFPKKINKNEIEKVNILFPNETGEQIKIGEFFKNLDDLIAQNQKKYDKLVNMKKACLDKMFPKDGADTPEVRFKGFRGEWEKRTLGEIYSFKYGHFNNNPSNGGKYPVYGANGIIGGYTKFNAENSIVIGHMGEYAGCILWGEGKHFVTYNGTITVPKLYDIESKFGYFMFLNLNVKRICNGSGQPFLSYNMLEKINCAYPKDYTEQTQIGTFFQNLDNLITLRKTELEKLKNMKKACLDKMFI